MKNTAIVLLSLLCCVYSAAAQEEPIKPIDLPMSFSGNYGELRHNHFHQGLDWRTGGKVGDPVHAIKSGFISRVSVSPVGYGNAVYIDHPDGTTSVYGHLLEFIPELAERVRSEQYAKESFSVNLTFSSEEFPVSQGDVIGKVGSTGSSGGPHLHMEVRDTGSETPVNYLSLGYYFPEDNMAPTVRKVCFYGLDTLEVPSAFRVMKTSDPAGYSDVVRVPGRSYVAVDAYDLQDGTTGKLAVEEYRVLLDGNEIFDFKVGDISFDEGPYIKSVIQYNESYRGGGDMIKSYVDPSNLLSYKIRSVGDGLFVLEDYDLHSVRIEVSDDFGNTAVRKFRIRRDDSVTAPARDTSRTYLNWLWFTPNLLIDDDLTYILPAGALYNSILFSYKKIREASPSEGIFSSIFSIGEQSVAQARNGILDINADVPAELEDKSYTARYPGLAYAGPRYGAEVPFGDYCIAVDVEGPAIRVDSNNQIRVRDEYSGTASVSVEIDGEWHLSMFKRGRVYIMDRNSILKGTHDVSVKALDYLGNETILKQKMIF